MLLRLPSSAARELEMAAQACPGATRVLEMAARASPGAVTARQKTAGACPGLEMAARACLARGWQSALHSKLLSEEHMLGATNLCSTTLCCALLVRVYAWVHTSCIYPYITRVPGAPGLEKHIRTFPFLVIPPRVGLDLFRHRNSFQKVAKSSNKSYEIRSL